MFFTDERHAMQLMAEIESQPPTVEPASARAQRELKARWERRHNPDRLLMPGEERHDA